MALHHRHDDPLSSSTRALDFSRPNGPLVAVAGLGGGAGTSTLAHLLAAAAAAESSAPILLAETGGPSATLRLLTGAGSRRSLVDIARDLEAGRASADPPFVVVDDGLRLIASVPQFEREVGEHALETVFDDARSVHGLTVVDCGSLAGVADLVALRRATHVVWCVRACEVAVARSTALFDAIALPITGRELLAIRQVAGDAVVPTTAWTPIALQRDCDVVLMPDAPGIATMPLADRMDRTGVALAALAGALR